MRVIGGIILILVITISCNISNRVTPPDFYFDGKDLVMGEAIYNGDTKKIEELLSSGGYNVNARGNLEKGSFYPMRFTYLHYAVRTGDIKVVEKLLSLGADIDEISIDTEGVMYNNIYTACDKKDKKMIELLIKHGVNLNHKFKESPISALLMGDNQKELIDLLLNSGADINHQSFISGDTPLATAYVVYKLDYVNYFLDKGADPLLMDSNGDNLAIRIQDDIKEGRLTDQGLEKITELKQRLIKEYGVVFPVKDGFIEGRGMQIARYKALSEEDKAFLDDDFAKRMQEKEAGLEKVKEKERKAEMAKEK